MTPSTLAGAAYVATMPTPLLLLTAAMALAVWCAIHLVFSPRNSWQICLHAAAGLAAGTGATWLIWQSLARFLTLNGLNHPLLMALVAAVLIEAVVMFYRFERQVLPNFQSRLILALRIVFVAVLLVVLTEPTITRLVTDNDERIVAVVIDDSASMDKNDPHASRSERLQLAELLAPGSVPARVEPTKLAQSLAHAGTRIADEASWLRHAAQGTGDESQSSEALQSRVRWGLVLPVAILGVGMLVVAGAIQKHRRWRNGMLAAGVLLLGLAGGVGVLNPKDDQAAADPLEARRQLALTALSEASAMLTSLNSELVQLGAESGLPAETRLSVERLSKTLTDNGGKTLDQVRQGIEAASQREQLRGDAQRLAAQLDQATAAMSAVANQLSTLESAAADAAYQRLSAAVRTSVDEAAAKTRHVVATAVLSGGQDNSPGLAQKLSQRYTVKFYRFAAAPTETTLAAWQAPPDSAANSSERTLARQATDVVSAVAKVQADVPRKLSGIVMVGDGRHNAKSAVESAARSLSMQSVPVGGVLIGSTTPFVDTAVTEATAPRSVQLGDRVAIRTGVFVAGLANQTVDITLSHEGKVIDTKKVQVQGSSYRTTVELGDIPKKTGLTTYEVKITPSASERSQENNVRRVHVQVTDDPIRLLLVDDRPRWEYRFLRALFADRDKSVRLQHVLIHPERIEGIPAPPPVHASAGRGAGEAEATALPAKAEDWMQFDAIILGDVSPQELKPEIVEVLKRYVGERGGRLIVVAGQNFMPQAFAGSPLAEMLPVVCNPPPAQAAAVEPGYLVRLTPEGERNTITQLAADPAENRLIWEGFPEQHVRHPIHEATVDARVLAYAWPMNAPEVFRRTAATPEEAEQLEKQRNEFMQRNALIAVKPYKAGDVLLLTFDGTWRFRYQVGDTRHHPFWGQVVRWAASNKLSVGNELVRLGTDQTVYAAEESVTVRARLQDKNHVGVISQGATAVVRDDKREVLRKKLEPVAGSPGMYSVDMGRLPAGKEYQVGLVVDDAGQGELAAAAGKVTTQIAVVQPPSEELVDLSADPTILQTLASHTKSVPGLVVGPAESDRVLDVMGPASSEIVREERYPLWHSWPVMIGLIGLAATEWIVRKKGGLT